MLSNFFLNGGNARPHAQFISIHVAHLRTGVPERTLRDWAIKGKVRAIKVGRRPWSIDHEDLKELAYERGCRRACV